MQWAADWDKLRIIPDFIKKSVWWEIPNLRSTNTKIQVHNGYIGQEVPIDTKQFWVLQAIVFAGQPMLMVGTLSDDQRYPVFVLGFRIISDTELKDSKINLPSWPQ